VSKSSGSHDGLITLSIATTSSVGGKNKNNSTSIEAPQPSHHDVNSVTTGDNINNDSTPIEEPQPSHCSDINVITGDNIIKNNSGPIEAPQPLSETATEDDEEEACSSKINERG
jgi:hypothetical protein